MRFLLALIFTMAVYGQQPPSQGSAPPVQGQTTAPAQAQTAPAQGQAAAPAQAQTAPAQGQAAAPAQAQTAPAQGQTATPAQAAAPAPADQKTAETANPTPAGGEWFTGSIDLGYRWVTSVGGNLQEYRTVVDLLERPTLLGLDFSLTDPNKHLFDQVNVRASGWGGEPYNTAHLDARKLGIYDFNIDYRNIAYFSESPSFANPAAPGGYNEQSLDIRQRMFSANLELFSGSHFVPFLAYDYNSGNGTGIETWVQQSNNEFPVPYNLRDSTNNYRGGLRIEYSRFHITLAEGGTTYKDDDSAYDSTIQFGDNLIPVLGETLYLTGLQQAYGIRGTSTYSQALLTASPTSWLNIYGQFLYSEPKTTVHFNETATGNFSEISELLFYSGQDTVGTGTANQPHTTANIGFELRPLPRLRIVESFMTDRYHDAASPFVATALILAGSPMSSVSALNYSQVVNYNQEETDIMYDLGAKLTLRGGYRYIWGDATVLAGQLSSIQPTVSGALQRNVGLGGLTYRANEKLSVNLDYEGAESDRVYFRTSLNDYNKARARARYQLNSALGFTANFQVLNNQNPDPNIRLDFQSRDNSLAVFWTPKNSKRFSLTGEYDRATVRSDISYLGLFLAPSTSIYRDNEHIATSAVNVVLPGIPNGKLTFGGSMFLSAGSRPTRYYQPLAQLSIPLQKHIYWNTEWQYFGYGESLYWYEGFRTHVFTTGVRLSK